MIPLGILGTLSGGAAAGAYELISSTILTGTSSQIDFTSIASTYKHLQIRMTMRNSGTSVLAYTRLNSDSSALYSSHRLAGTGSSVASSAWTNGTELYTAVITESTTTANAFTGAIVDILDYASTSKNKTLRFFYGSQGSSSTPLGIYSGLYQSTSAISTISIFPETGSFVSGSRFSLYGIKG